MQLAGRTMLPQTLPCVSCKTQGSWHWLSICCMQTSCQGQVWVCRAEMSWGAWSQLRGCSICFHLQFSAAVCSFWIIYVKIRPEQSILWRTTALKRKPLLVLLRHFEALRAPKHLCLLGGLWQWSTLACSCNVLWRCHLGWITSQGWVSMWSLGVTFG